MFERNKVDNAHDRKATAATIELDDGRRISGRFLIAQSKSLIEILNGPTQFIEFEPFDGEIEVISKAAIRSLKTIATPGGRNPAAMIRNPDSFNPFDILGVEKGASREELRSAYRKKSMNYHPDRFAQTELPREVMTYLEVMARRINAAYEVLDTETAKAEAFAAQRTAPIYQSGTAA